MAIGLSQNGTTHYTSAGPTEEMLVATLKGVITLRREGGKKWGVARRSLEEHHIGSLWNCNTSCLGNRQYLP